ncbi:hypothetical protein ASPZODRAFT_76957 [Penicilliopsis zonata CBS 506.65]|uniref:Enoyl-CoA hydratase n=1 Tax=Penicilliopsis zonata CBS 506.65 TaxID=1073090 RepID=A0A1L9S5E2_9EURO|nr:hypothetical protein ASPZODRAFT_76957 [Penicilliopsis zonata CBS 506.65]OJJ42384.1 hypothetical protein ASPZODRAFT_76957 [Penicilliopsis zonata CBS 506.65]
MNPPPTQFLKLSFPAERVLLVTMDRPEKLNAMTTAAYAEFGLLWPWFDAEPSLSVAILTGAGHRAFCAGADLADWADRQAGKTAPAPLLDAPSKEAAQTQLLSRRLGKKPVIAAVNGLAHGGGFEMVVNCDLVVASRSADFCLPELQRGVVPIAGCLPRLIRTLGLQRASELVLTGRRIPAAEAYAWGLVNRVVEPEGVLEEAVRLAVSIAANSPDAILCARRGLREGWIQADVEDATQTTFEDLFTQLRSGENMLEGMLAFKERRPPKWVPSKL